MNCFKNFSGLMIAEVTRNILVITVVIIKDLHTIALEATFVLRKICDEHCYSKTACSNFLFFEKYLPREYNKLVI